MKKRNLVFHSFVLLLTIGFILGGCASQSAQMSSSASSAVQLAPGKWVPSVKARLETLIAANAGKGKKVIFDFDNTLICRDIGESTFAALVEEGKLSAKSIPSAITPSFMLKDKKVDAGTAENITVYYEDFLSATKHQTAETTPYSNGYAWVVQIMAGMTPSDFLPYSEKAYAEGTAQKDTDAPDLKETKINGYRQPFFYPEMVDLAGLFLKNGYDVYVISASNVWTVRWMVAENLNPLIQAKHGKSLGIPADHVIGVSVLLKDKRTGKLYKDPLLVKENNAYAKLDSGELAHYELTAQVVYPLTGYFGKVANILKYITLERPFFVAGDSPNDHPMLNQGVNRLWITRLEKMGYQEKTVKQMKNSLPGNWMLQPVLYKKAPGFVSSQADLDRRLKPKPSAKETPNAIIKLYKGMNQLKDF